MGGRDHKKGKSALVMVWGAKQIRVLGVTVPGTIYQSLGFIVTTRYGCLGASGGLTSRQWLGSSRPRRGSMNVRNFILRGSRGEVK